MPYEKTVWDETVPVSPGRLNNLETQYAQALADFPSPDNYDDRLAITLTVGVSKQFATIQDAINSLKKVNAAQRSLVIDPGIYNEPIDISGFIGGTIYLRSANSAQFMSLQQSISVQRNHCLVRWSDLQVLNGATVPTFSSNYRVELSHYEKVAAGAIGLHLSSGTYVLTNAVISNASIDAIRLFDQCKAHLQSVSGTGNSYGVNATGGSLVTRDSYSLASTNGDLKSGASQIWTQ